MSEAEIDAETLVKPANRRPKTGGRPPKVTATMVEFVAEKVALGVPKCYACRLASPPIDDSTLNRALEKYPAFRAVWETKIARILDDALATIRGKDTKSLPVGTCWWLERRFGEFFSTKQAAATQINVGMVSIEPDVMRRAAQLIREHSANRAIRVNGERRDC